MNRDQGISVPLPTIRRLPMYFSLLQKAAQENQTAVSSSQLAADLGLEPIQVRKDLEAIGVSGQPRVGFPVAGLIHAIEEFLGWDNVTDAFIIGAGHLGTALAGYQGFENHGLNVVALFDNDPRKVGQTIHGKEVLHIDKLGNLANRLHVHIAILTVPAEVAANAAQLAIEAGIQAIWNFTPTKLAVPEGIILERVDLAASLAVLSSKLAARLRPAEPTVPTQETQA
ncbi:MAG: redox-sensing transcriptional repressor Rex [Phycisphaerales bacterium]